jgi:hypothetical protein
MGFEPTIPASERAKSVHALDCSATVTGNFAFTSDNRDSTALQGRKYLLLNMYKIMKKSGHRNRHLFFINAEDVFSLSFFVETHVTNKLYCVYKI